MLTTVKCDGLRWSLNVLVIVGKIGVLCVLHLLFVLLDHVRIHLDFGRSQCRHSDELQVGVSEQFASQVQEWLFKVVVALSRDIVILKIGVKTGNAQKCLLEDSSCDGK